MRLALISHAYLELGYRHALQDLALAPGVELAWITPERYKLGLQTSSGEFSGESEFYKTYPVPIALSGRQGTFVYHPRPLQKALDEFKPDIILHEQEVFALGGGQIAYIAKKRRIPLVMFVNENVHRKLALPRQWLRDYVLRRCDALIPISAGAARVHKDWGFERPQAILAQIGVHLNGNPDFRPRDPEVLRVCFAGRLTHLKGVDCLLRALAVLRGAGVSVVCTVAGRGEDRDKLEELTRTLGLDSVVTFAGMLVPEQVRALFASSDVIVVPSRRSPTWEEQFGRILVEAMAQATVTVGSATGAIPEVIDSEELIFAEDDQEGLARVLRHLAEDPVFLETQKRRLWERARSHYERGIVTRRKVAFLEQVARKDHAGAAAVLSEMPAYIHK